MNQNNKLILILIWICCCFCFQALNGFLMILTCEGEVFFATHSIESYLGFHQVINCSIRCCIIKLYKCLNLFFNFINSRTLYINQCMSLCIQRIVRSSNDSFCGTLSYLLIYLACHCLML